MKSKIILKQTNKEFIPLDSLHHLLQASILSIQPKDISERVHEGGIRSVIDPKRKFKEISFSSLIGNNYEIKNKKIRFKDDVTIYISSNDANLLNKVVSNVFLRTLYIGNAEFSANIQQSKPSYILAEFKEVETIEVIGSTVSPIVLRDIFKGKNGKNQVKFFFPGDELFNQKIIGNLKNKFSAVYQTEDLTDFKFEIEPIFTKIKNTKYKNSLYAGTCGNFRIISNYKTLKVVESLGLGSKNAQGFGQILI